MDLQLDNVLTDLEGPAVAGFSTSACVQDGVPERWARQDKLDLHADEQEAHDPAHGVHAGCKARTTQAEACKTSHDNGQVLARSVAIPMVTGPLSMAWPAE